MNLQEQLTFLIEKERKSEFVPFLKALDASQRKSLVPQLKKLNKEYLEFIPVTGSNGSISYSPKANERQRRMLNKASFVLFNKSEFEKSSGGPIFMDRGEMADVLEWYCPTWFSDYVNKFVDAEYFPYYLEYDWVMELTEQGYLSPSDQLLAKIMPSIIYENSGNTWQYRPENLLKREITLNEHIWFVFAHESNINWSDRYKRFDAGTAIEEKGWVPALSDLARKGKIDRTRLLKESLLASNRNFDKTLSGWFADLFIKLEPKKEELLGLQKELLHGFNSPHSKIVNTSLKYLKTLAGEKTFLLEEFLENAPLLLASETKSVVSSTLMVLDTLAKKNPLKTGLISQLACQAFIHPDDELQTRSAKLVRKYGSPADEPLQETLFPFLGSLFINARNLLQDFVPSVEEPAPSSQDLTDAFAPAPTLSIENRITPIRTFDELVYLASQAMDNNQPFHFELLATALVELQEEVRGENISKLEPALQRAYSFLLGDWPSTAGYLEHLLATFLVDYAIFLIGKYPQETQTIEAIHDKAVAKDHENKAKWPEHYFLRIFAFEAWKTHTENPATVYEPHKELLLAVKEKLRKEDKLPLLSTPTHAPGWICPVTLVKRLAKYQSVGVKPNSMDLQIALSRCALDEKGEELAATEGLTGEFKNLMRFLLTPEAAPQAPFHSPAAWVVASLAKAPDTVYQEFSGFPFNHLSRNTLTGQVGWQLETETYSDSKYDYTAQKYITVPRTRQVLRIQQEKAKSRDQGLKGKITQLLPFKKAVEPLIYEHLMLRGKDLDAVQNDITRLLLLTPTNPEPLLAQVLGHCLTHPTFWSQTDKKMVTATISCLLDIWNKPGTTAHLFVATCLLSSDKTIQSFAAEIWVKGVSTGTIDSSLIGDIIGLQERHEFAPLKRFTDLIISNLWQVSNTHQAELEKLLAALLQQLPEEPIKNLKRLLEIYLEVVSLNNSAVADELEVNLVSWKKSPGLSKVIRLLEQRRAVEVR